MTLNDTQRCTSPWSQQVSSCKRPGSAPRMRRHRDMHSRALDAIQIHHHDTRYGHFSSHGG